ncbi:MAG: VOC family protein [Dehalococcoidia bacterium]
MPTNWGVIPSIRVQDMKTALDFYQSTLGFKLTRGDGTEDNNSLDRGDAHIMIERATAFYSPDYNAAIKQRIGGRSAMALYIEAPDLEALHEKLRASGANVIDPLADRPWGQSEFTVEDPEGNWLTFWKAPAG